MAKSKYPVVSRNPDVQKFYEDLRKKGNQHLFAEMLAMQQAPRVRDTYSPMHPRKGRGQGGRGF